MKATTPPRRTPAASAASPATLLTRALLKRWPLPDPDRNGSKEDRGQVLVVGGSVEIPGAALLAAVAALRAGAGKLQVATAAPVAAGLALALPEARVIAVPADPRGEPEGVTDGMLEAAAQCDALVIGPGLADTPACKALAAALIKVATGVVVLDAGALCTAPAPAARGVVITPHAGEMAALTGEDIEAIQDDPETHARRHAGAHGQVTVLKGRETHLLAPEGQHWINRRGSVGLGTSGSGDVLAGLIAGLAARGADAAQAAAWGVFVHAQAGERLARDIGTLGFLAREIPGLVPALLDGLRAGKR